MSKRDGGLDMHAAICKAQEILNGLPSSGRASEEAFIVLDIIATLLEKSMKWTEAIDFRLRNMEIARVLTSKSIPMYTPATQLAVCYDSMGEEQ